MIICREQAVCIFYCEDFNEENAARCSKKIENIGDVDICYLHDPTDPVLVFNTRIKALPYKFLRYASASKQSNPKIPSQEKAQETQEKQLNSVAQIVQFINEAFIPFNPHNNAVYNLKLLTTKDIFHTVSLYTNYFDDKNLKSFTTWCSRKKLHFFKADEVRKKQKSENSTVVNRTRSLYVMKKEFFGKAISAITEYPSNYKLLVKNLEEEGLELIGYVRKSKGKEKDGVRVRLLEAMANRLTERCLIKTVYASPFSDSMDEIASRDLCEKSKSLVRQLNNVSGSAQDMMNHIKATNTDICLIVIDFAGLSRNCEDIKSFVRSHPKLKKILIDLLPVNNTVKTFTREDILNDYKFMEDFQCRKAPVQRSL